MRLFGGSTFHSTSIGFWSRKFWRFLLPMFFLKPHDISVVVRSLELSANPSPSQSPTLWLGIRPKCRFFGNLVVPRSDYPYWTPALLRVRGVHLGRYPSKFFDKQHTRQPPIALIISWSPSPSQSIKHGAWQSNLRIPTETLASCLQEPRAVEFLGFHSTHFTLYFQKGDFSVFVTCKDIHQTNPGFLNLLPRNLVAISYSEYNCIGSSFCIL